MSDTTRSETACPVCGKHTLALDEPPRIDVLGVQPYSDLVGMGDLPASGAIGIFCLECGTHWRDKGAFDRNEPDDVGVAADERTLETLEEEPDAGSDPPGDSSRTPGA